MPIFHHFIQNVTSFFTQNPIFNRPFLFILFFIENKKQSLKPLSN